MANFSLHQAGQSLAVRDGETHSAFFAVSTSRTAILLATFRV
jgi:hypothetical protein